MEPCRAFFVNACTCSDREGDSREAGHDGPHTCVCGAAWTDDGEGTITEVRRPGAGWPE